MGMVKSMGWSQGMEGCPEKRSRACLLEFKPAAFYRWRAGVYLSRRLQAHSVTGTVRRLSSVPELAIHEYLNTTLN